MCSSTLQETWRGSDAGVVDQKRVRILSRFRWLLGNKSGAGRNGLAASRIQRQNATHEIMLPKRRSDRVKIASPVKISFRIRSETERTRPCPHGNNISP